MRCKLSDHEWGAIEPRLPNKPRQSQVSLRSPGLQAALARLGDSPECVIICADDAGRNHCQASRDRPALRAEGVTRLAIFGSRSRSRGDARPDSDLDVLIDVDPAAPFSGLNLSGVGLIVEQATGQTQVSMRPSLDPRVAERAADDIVEVF